MGRFGGSLLSLGCALSLCCVALPARAFCRTSSCELGELQRVEQGMKGCARDESGCVTEGQPLHWQSPCIDYVVQLDGSPKLGIDADQLQQAAQQAFDAWQNAACPGGGSPRFQARFQGYVSCARHEFVCGSTERNINALMFHDQAWPDQAGVIAATTPTGGLQSGLVSDADLELNSQDYDFTLGVNATGMPLADVLAHELGHFLGLSHSNTPGALMSKGYAEVVLSQELLTDDDVQAICTAYPPGQALDCPAPSAPAYDECQLEPGQQQPCKLASMTHDESQENGCSCRVQGRSTRFGWFTLLPLAVLRTRRQGRRDYEQRL